MNAPPFHLAFPVTNLATVREFYCSVLRCEIGRESERWIDFNFFGHQITAHLDEADVKQSSRNQVDDKAVPARHFGVILDWSDWDELLMHVKSHGIAFYIEPYTRFAGEVGEQRTFFIRDPSDNFLEFKCYQHKSTIFKKE
jgi:extradiol dioxygenase family protein